ncbi:MAG TPA: hypothetical protein PK339_14350 [Flavitalea sp.]|nr:hypothetical protein [Flavitalea sp.]
MKYFRYGLFTLLVIFIAGCYEITEEISFDANGSGVYATNMDMSALMEMMKTMAGEEELARGGLDRAIDTVIPMKRIMEESKDMSAEYKSLYAAGTMALKMNIKENIFKADMKVPFNSFEQLQKLMSGSGSGGMSEMFKKIYGKDENASSSPSDQGLDELNAIFDVTVNNGEISKKLNKEKYDLLMNKPEIAQMREMAGAGMEILYTSVIKLPRPVKKSDNPMIKLSDDKKTATIKYNLLTIFDAPESFSYSIVY